MQVASFKNFLIYISFFCLSVSFLFFCGLQQKIMCQSGEIIYLNFKVTRDLTSQTAPGYSSAQQQLQ